MRFKKTKTALRPIESHRMRKGGLSLLSALLLVVLTVGMVFANGPYPVYVTGQADPTVTVGVTANGQTVTPGSTLEVPEGQDVTLVFSYLFNPNTQVTSHAGAEGAAFNGAYGGVGAGGGAGYVALDSDGNPLSEGEVYWDYEAEAGMETDGQIPAEVFLQVPDQEFTLNAILSGQPHCTTADVYYGGGMGAGYGGFATSILGDQEEIWAEDEGEGEAFSEFWFLIHWIQRLLLQYGGEVTTYVVIYHPQPEDVPADPINDQSYAFQVLRWEAVGLHSLYATHVDTGHEKLQELTDGPHPGWAAVHYNRFRGCEWYGRWTADGGFDPDGFGCRLDTTEGKTYHRWFKDPRYNEVMIEGGYYTAPDALAEVIWDAYVELDREQDVLVERINEQGMAIFAQLIERENQLEKDGKPYTVPDAATAKQMVLNAILVAPEVAMQ